MRIFLTALAVLVSGCGVIAEEAASPTATTPAPTNQTPKNQVIEWQAPAYDTETNPIVAGDLQSYEIYLVKERRGSEITDAELLKTVAATAKPGEKQSAELALELPAQIAIKVVAGSGTSDYSTPVWYRNQ